MPENIEFYRHAWAEAGNQPKVAGPNSFFYQRIGRYCRAIACVATRPFAVPVGVTSEVTGLTKQFVGECLGQLVRNDVLKVVTPGAPGRFTRYRYVNAAGRR